MDWDKLRVFNAVAAAGSLTHAGEVLYLSQPAISRQIRALEESLGATLFHRHPRGLILTSQGELLFKATNEMRQHLTAAEAHIRDTCDEAFGDLKVTTTAGFGSLWLAPRLERFMESYPGLSIELILTEVVLDLPMREADVAIRMREPSQADLIRRPLMDTAVQLFASQDYLAKHGMPKSIEELSTRRLITYISRGPQSGQASNWLHHKLCIHSRASMAVNNYHGVLKACQNGIGVAVLPEYVVDPEMKLIRVMPELSGPDYTMYLAYPEELKKSKRINVFREFIIEEVEQFKIKRKQR